MKIYNPYINNIPSHPQKSVKVTVQQKALEILLEAGKSKNRDTVSISAEARSFSKKSIMAKIDRSANVSVGQLIYYFDHYNNPTAILDAVNFGKNASAGYNPEFKEYGVINFDYNGGRQVIPIYAVPKINAGCLPPICAVDNSLVLENKSYYRWTTSSGKQCTWAVHNGNIGWAHSESYLAEPTGGRGTNYVWEMHKVSTPLSCLAKGESLYGIDRKEVLSACEQVGITPGFFSIDAGAGKRNYFLKESGQVLDVDGEIKRLNRMNWIEAGNKEGDIVSIYGNEYAVDSKGFIHASAADGLKSPEIIYPGK